MRRGMSLVEILVGSALLLMLFGLIVMLLLPGWRAWTKSEGRSDVSQNAIVVMGRVSTDFRNAHASSVWAETRAVTDPVDGRPARHDYVIFLVALDYDGNIVVSPDGDPIWQKRIVFYHDGEAQQVRSTEIPLPAPTTEPSPLVVKSYTPTAKDRVVARNVRSFELSWRQPNLQMIVETRRDGFRSKLESMVTPIMAAFAPPTPTPSASPSPTP